MAERVNSPDTSCYSVKVLVLQSVVWVDFELFKPEFMLSATSLQTNNNILTKLIASETIARYIMNNLVFKKQHRMSRA